MTPNIRFVQKTTLAAFSMFWFVCIKALLSPASQNIWEKLMAIVAIATTPKSSGASNFAKIRNMIGWAVRDTISTKTDHFMDFKALLVTF